jgi:hypothetical protein
MEILAFRSLGIVGYVFRIDSPRFYCVLFLSGERVFPTPILDSGPFWASYSARLPRSVFLTLPRQSGSASVSDLIGSSFGL